MFICFRDRNAVPEIKPHQTAELTYNEVPLKSGQLSTVLPALGLLVYNKSTQDAFVFINENRDKGIEVGAGRERSLDGLSIYGVSIENLGDEPIPRGAIIPTLFTDHSALVQFGKLADNDRKRTIRGLRPLLSQKQIGESQ